MFNYNGNEYELPKKTMALQNKIDAVYKAKTTVASYQRMMELLITALGTEKVDELLETHDVNQVDLTEMNILANALIIGYDKKVAKPQMESMCDMINSDVVNKTIAMGNTVGIMQKMNK